MQIGCVLVDRVGFKDGESAVVTLKQFVQRQPIGVTPLTQRNRTQESQQTTSNFSFYYA